MRDKLVAVIWDDAHVEEGEICGRDEIRERTTLQVVTFGLLMRDDERTVAVAAETIPEEDRFRGVTYIPKSMVREIVPLGVWPKRTRKPAPVVTLPS